jgi:hypothetical protein
MRCSKTGLTDQDFKTILDVLNVYDPNDIIEHIPEMASPEFMQEVQSAFKAVLAHVNRSKYNSDLGAIDGSPVREVDKPKVVDALTLANEQYIHGLS